MAPQCITKANRKYEFEMFYNMPQKEFFDIFCNKLSSSVKFDLMTFEEYRLKTYPGSWPHGDKLVPAKMARAGFYYYEAPDVVECTFCKLRLHKFEATDDPMVCHAGSNLPCSFIRGNYDNNNKEIRAPTYGRNEKKPDFLRRVSVMDSDQVVGVRRHYTRSKDFATVEKREKTFERAENKDSYPAKKLAESGFYYMPDHNSRHTDRPKGKTKCYVCEVELADWLPNDDPDLHHALWSPHCMLLIANIGQEKINELRANVDPKNKAMGLLEDPNVDFMGGSDWKREALFKILTQLGHDPDDVNLAIDLIKEPEKLTTSEVLENVYKIADGELSKDDLEPPEGAAAAAPPPEPREKLPPFICYGYSTPNKSVPANQLAVECGHVVYCLTCAKRCVLAAKAAPCPFPDCGAPMRRFIKTYLN